MTLTEAVEKLRRALEGKGSPDTATLQNIVQVLELNDTEWQNFPDNDSASQQWAEYLLKVAKQRGWIRMCVTSGLLPKSYLDWPQHNWTYKPKLKETKDGSKSVRPISGGAFEQKRRKH